MTSLLRSFGRVPNIVTFFFLYLIFVYLWLFLELAECDCAMGGYNVSIIHSHDHYFFAKVFLSCTQHCRGVPQFPTILLHLPNEIRFCKLFLALDLTVPQRRPFTRFESVSLPCFFRICFPGRKLTLHACLVHNVCSM